MVPYYIFFFFFFASHTLSRIVYFHIACFPYHSLKYNICKVDEQHYLWIKPLKFFFFFFFFWGGGGWGGGGGVGGCAGQNIQVSFRFFDLQTKWNAI